MASERPLYRLLAERANAVTGCGVSAWQVGRWTRDGLLPSTTTRRSLGGRAGFVTVPGPGIEEQLVALSRLRVALATSSLNKLAIALYLDGWPIATARVRAAILARLPTSLPVEAMTEDQREELTWNVASTLGRRLPASNTNQRRRDYGVAVLLRILTGEAPGLHEGEARAIEQLSGMVPYARTETLAGVGPWLDGPARDGLLVLPKAFAFSALRSHVESASDDELSAVRPLARSLWRDLPAMVQLLELLYGRNAFGLGTLGAMARDPEASVILALVLRANGLEGQFREYLHVWGAEPEARDRLTEALRSYWNDHPRHRTAIRTSGVAGLIERGLVSAKAVGTDSTNLPSLRREPPTRET